MRVKMKYICRKFINHQIKKCLLFRCRDAVVPVVIIIMQTLNWTNQCPLFMTVRHIFEISEDDHPSLVTHARDIWWTLDSANAFVSPGVNSRGELVPSHGASRRRLGDKHRQVGYQVSRFQQIQIYIISITKVYFLKNVKHWRKTAWTVNGVSNVFLLLAWWCMCHACE
jgi:hypothetical protein